MRKNQRREQLRARLNFVLSPLQHFVDLDQTHKPVTFWQNSRAQASPLHTMTGQVCGDGKVRFKLLTQAFSILHRTTYMSPYMCTTEMTMNGTMSGFKVQTVCCYPHLCTLYKLVCSKHTPHLIWPTVKPN